MRRPHLVLALLDRRWAPLVGAFAFAATLSALTLGCNEVLGINEPLDDDGTARTTTGGISNTSTTTTGGGSSPRSDAGAADGNAPPQGGGSNGLGLDGGGRTVEFAWAEWPMPNPTISGLPYPQMYDVKVAGTVTDRVTGLTWQQDVDVNSYMQADARAYCTGLGLAGGGFRLPSRIELLSIIDYTTPNPVVDPRAFPNTPSASFWSASPIADDAASAWTVFFGFGNGLASGAALTTANRVRCVR